MTLLSDAPHLVRDRDELEAFWMPFTANRQFKSAPRLFVKAEGMYYTTDDGRRVLDGFAGLWCCNAGHCRKPITEAIQKQAAVMDYSPAFQMGHPLAFELANRIVELAPGKLDHVFFCNSGSEAVDTALKIALGYHRMRGEGTRTRFIGRERGYHGVGFGGISVGGIVANRKMFGNMLTGVDHLPHTLNIEKNAYSRGQPEWGAHLADELERLVALHDASTIAAVIVEPIAGSTGVILPPRGYLQRLREITKKHGILLIFDEVITAFGRVGGAFAADVYGVEPDMITFAKGVTSGTVPMGGVIVSSDIYRGLHGGAAGGDRDLPRLHLLGAPARVRGGCRDAAALQGRGPLRARGEDGAGARERAALFEGRAPRDRHPQPGAGGRRRAGAPCRCPGCARLRGLPALL